ncbi:MAG: ATP-dependent Clp protease adaptor protein ClpS [Candidatus Paceibacter sp.]|jgi:hypothetical protein|nr:ATP-dependent Clp protease adaptor protein ClpS [Candidatus Paceibacter sp.]
MSNSKWAKEDKDETSYPVTQRHTWKKPKPAPPKRLPLWNVILHDDDKNELIDVAAALTKVLGFTLDRSFEKAKEANDTKTSVLKTAHKELAEMFKEQLEKYRANLEDKLTITIELAE